MTVTIDHVVERLIKQIVFMMNINRLRKHFSRDVIFDRELSNEKAELLASNIYYLFRVWNSK